MTRDQVDQVQKSFKSLAPFRDYAARIFYERLFEIDPAMQGLFAGTDMRMQGAKLMTGLGTLVGMLRKPEAMLDKPGLAAAEAFGFGVQECHFGSIGKALIAMLERLMGHDWSNELWIAWADAYALVTRAMRQVVRAAAQPA